MKNIVKSIIFAVALPSAATVTPVFGQKVPAKPAKPIIFAVLDGGKTAEPIAYINKGKLEETANGMSETNIITAFTKQYYKVGTKYSLVFGGTNSGTVTVKSSNPKSDCAKNMATTDTKTTKTPLGGFVMGLATNAAIKNTTYFRRKPTAVEKSEIDALVKKEFAKSKLTGNTLKYHNLTGIDIDGNGRAEFVGSYWIDVDSKTRNLLFFIAELGTGGKYSLVYADGRSIDQASTMSGDIKNVDEGIYHELFLDSFDYDGDGIGEIFTHQQSFEGAGFTAYKKTAGKWKRVFEVANYHCAF